MNTVICESNCPQTPECDGCKTGYPSSYVHGCRHTGKIKARERGGGIVEYRCPSCGLRWFEGGTVDDPVFEIIRS